MPKQFPEINEDQPIEASKQTNLMSNRLENIGRILNRQAEIKGVQDSAMFKKLDTIFNQFVEDYRDEDEAAMRGATADQTESFNSLKKILIDMKKDNGENLKEYRQELSKLLGKVSAMEGPKSPKTFIQNQAASILEQTEKPVNTLTSRFGQAIADKFGMKELSLGNFFTLKDSFEKDSILGKTFGTSKDKEAEELELANLEGNLEQLTKEPKVSSRPKPSLSRFSRRRSFVGAAEVEENEAQQSQPERFSQSIKPSPTQAVEGSGQVTRKNIPQNEGLKITTLTVDRVIAKSLDVADKKPSRQLPQRDEKGRFLPSSSVLKAPVLADLASTPEQPKESSTNIDVDVPLGGKGILKKSIGVGASALSFAAPAAAMLGVGAAADFGLGKLGVGKDTVGEDLVADEKQDDANWQKMNWWEKAQSGAARGIEKVGSLAFLGNMSKQAQTERIAKESAFFAEKEGGASPVMKKETLINAAPTVLKRDEMELAKLENKPQAPIIVQAPAAQAPAAQQSIIMPIKGSVRPNESALEKMQTRTFTR